MVYFDLSDFRQVAGYTLSQGANLSQRQTTVYTHGYIYGQFRVVS